MDSVLFGCLLFRVFILGFMDLLFFYPPTSTAGKRRRGVAELGGRVAGTKDRKQSFKCYCITCEAPVDLECLLPYLLP